MKRLIKQSILLNINSPLGLQNWMQNNIQYGYLGKDNIIRQEINGLEFYNNYVLQSPEELLKNKYGICWDQVELQRLVFDYLKIDNYVIYMIQNLPPNYPTHSYSVIKQNNQFYWFENSWLQFQGIHGPFDSLKIIINLVHQNAVKIDNKIEKDWSYGLLKKPQYGIGCQEYMDFAADCIDYHLNDVNIRRIK